TATVTDQASTPNTSPASAALAVTLDTSAPLFQSAATSADGAQVILTYDTALSATTAAAAAFAVQLNGSANAVTGVAVNGTTLELTLTTAAVHGDTLTLGYSDPTTGDDANAIQDAAGNDAATLPNTTPVTNSVAPTDTTAPIFDPTRSMPTDNGRIMVDSDLVLRFDEELSAERSDLSQVALKDSAGTSVEAAFSLNGKTLVINPTAALSNGQSYYVNWEANALQDAAGNAVAALSDTTTYNVTADGIAPSLEVANSTPTDDGALVPTGEIRLQFSETLSTSLSNLNSILLKDGEGATVSASVAIVNDATSGKGAVLITPAADLIDGADYYVNWTPEAIKDIAGNAAAAVSDTTTFNFTVDGTPPVFDPDGSLPADGARIQAGANITLLFSEALSAERSDLTKVALKDSATDATVAADISLSGDSLVINPQAALSDGRAYYVTWGAGALQDAAGNAVAVVGDKTTYDIVADATAPVFQPLLSTPVDDSSEQPRAGNIVLQFSEALSAERSNLSQVFLKDVESDQVVTATMRLVENTLVIDPMNPLANNASYYVTWAAGALQDAAGNAVAALNDETSFNFTTNGSIPSLAELGTTTLADGWMNAAEAATPTNLRAYLPTNAVPGDTLELLINGVSFSTPKSVVLTAAETGLGYSDFILSAAELGFNGVKSLTAKVGQGAPSPALTFILDAATPGAPTLTETGSSDTADGWMNAAEALSTTFRVNLASTGAVAGDSVELLLGGASFVGTPKKLTLSATDIAAGQVDFNVLKANLGADGAKSLSARISDAAGNISAPSTAITFQLDTAAPGAPSLTETGSSDTEDGWMNAAEALST
ncbi:MAG: Ig-like domain-containing protein, partial [Chromatiaceae bacterium]|nr:Ig-like domain-containing protein [Chromatiaceae bacterium]